MPMMPAAVSKQAEIAEAVAEVERRLAPDVVYIRYEIGENWYGDWAIFFRSLLSDEAAEHRLHEVAKKVKQLLAERLDFPGLGLYAYYNVRSVSEQAALRDREWA
jgi:hypothetical protein